MPGAPDDPVLDPTPATFGLTGTPVFGPPVSLDTSERGTALLASTLKLISSLDSL